MKITVKTLKHDQFQLDVDSEDTILSVKQKIKETKDHDVPLQKLIYSGSILVDDKKLSDYNITEKDFMVLVVSKPSPKTSAGSSSTGNKTATPDTVKGSTTSTTVKETSTQKTDAIQSSATTTTPTTTDANTTTTTTTTATETTTASNTPTTGLFDNPNALVTGADYERAVQNMVEMGFDRELVVSAMRASFNNPNRAVEYLMSGIPELDNNPPTTTPSATTQPNVDTTTTTTTTTTAAAATNPMPGLTNPASTTGAPNLSSQPLNLFQQAQNLQRQRATQGGGGGGGGQGGGNIDDLNFLRNQPHFRSLRQFIQQNPGSLQPLLQQIGSTNPELLQLINSNPGMFMRLLQEPDEGEPQVVSVTQEEKEAIDRLEALGFDRALAIEAYLACDKNEEMAANFLFDHMNDDEN